MPLSEFTLRRRVKFHEIDSAGIVHFSSFFRYMEEAEHALWRAAGLSIAAARRQRRLSARVRRVRLPPAAALRGRVRRTHPHRGDSREEHALCCALTKGDEQIATGTMTVVCVSTDERRLMKARADSRQTSPRRFEVCRRRPTRRCWQVEQLDRDRLAECQGARLSELLHDDLRAKSVLHAQARRGRRLTSTRCDFPATSDGCR